MYSRKNVHEAGSTACAIKLQKHARGYETRMFSCVAAFGSDNKSLAVPDFDVEYRQDLSMTGLLGQVKIGRAYLLT